MRLEGNTQQTGRLVVILVAIAGLWLVFGRTPQRRVVSTWGGDGAGGQQSAILSPSNPLSALFNKEAAAPQSKLAADDHPQTMPWGNPLDSDRLVMTQGYGVGSHAPAATWGGIDLALDGDGNGDADPQGTMGKPVYATMSGVIKLTPNSHPAGNHIWVLGDEYKTGYAHLKEFAVEDGATVTRGTLIGYVGSTGQSSGPHLHYDVWHNGANVNPLDYGVLP